MRTECRHILNLISWLIRVSLGPKRIRNLKNLENINFYIVVYQNVNENDKVGTGNAEKYKVTFYREESNKIFLITQPIFKLGNMQKLNKSYSNNLENLAFISSKTNIKPKI